MQADGRREPSSFLSTIEPFHIDPERWWVDKPVSDYSTLKPEPDRDILLIVGDGHCVIDDLFRFFNMDFPFDLMCMNYSTKIVPPTLKIHHYIAGDSHAPDMREQARRMKGKALRHCWNVDEHGNFDIRWSRNKSKGWNGTTTNLGVKIGIALGYMKIVLAGCPMDNLGNWYTSKLSDDDIKKYKNHTAHLWKWTEIASRPIGRFIRSMSGNTKDLLGEPTVEWLEDC